MLAQHHEALHAFQVRTQQREISSQNLQMVRFTEEPLLSVYPACRTLGLQEPQPSGFMQSSRPAKCSSRLILRQNGSCKLAWDAALAIPYRKLESDRYSDPMCNLQLLDFGPRVRLAAHYLVFCIEDARDQRL